ncbi:MAG: hypothetical protein EON54_26305, partial [Alcaligenaceae bacterium]
MKTQAGIDHMIHRNAHTAFAANAPAKPSTAARRPLATPPHARSIVQGSHRLQRLAASMASIAALGLLGACSSSVNLPPWTPGASTPQASAPVILPATPAPVPATTQSAPVQITPVSPGGLQPAAPSVAPVAAPVTALPYGPAVAARFPAPSVVYNTPGLRAGRTAFTTAGEMRAWLQDLALTAPRTP